MHGERVAQFAPEGGRGPAARGQLATAAARSQGRGA